ncbi:MAG TPA: NRDE family protein, partial [Gammaproteobacteria bacterium]|nr:NRDE family protein [Gammaproteobacteria bacterium]
VHATRAVRDGAAFGPFNLFLHDGRELWFASNRAAAMQLGKGLHSFSNAPAGVEWPKTASARAGVEGLLSHPAPLEPLFALLAERDDAGSAEQRYQRTHFVVGPLYGTRCSTVVLVDSSGRATFAERSFDAAGHTVAEVRETFEIDRRI